MSTVLLLNPFSVMYTLFLQCKVNFKQHQVVSIFNSQKSVFNWLLDVMMLNY